MEIWCHASCSCNHAGPTIYQTNAMQLKKSSPAECHRSILALFCLLPTHYVHFLLVCQLEILEKVTISLEKDQEGQVYIHLTSCNCKSKKEKKGSRYSTDGIKVFYAASIGFTFSTFQSPTLPFLCKNPALSLVIDKDINCVLAETHFPPASTLSN